MNNPLTDTVVYKVGDSKWKAYYPLPPHEAVRMAYEEHTLGNTSGMQSPVSIEVTKGDYGYNCGPYFCPFEKDIVGMLLKGKV